MQEKELIDPGFGNVYAAIPYDISATFFYFKSWEDYKAKQAAHRNQYGDPVEEYEIEFIDGDSCDLFNTLRVNQYTLALWFEVYEELDDEDDLIKVWYLVNHMGYSLEKVAARLEDVHFYEGTPEEYARESMEESGLFDRVPEMVVRYFDYDAYACDLMAGGDITAWNIDGKDYVFLSNV